MVTPVVRREAVGLLVEHHGLSKRRACRVAVLAGSRAKPLDLAAGEASPKSRPEDHRDRELPAMREKIGDLTMANGLLEAKIDRLEGRAPFSRRRSRR